MWVSVFVLILLAQADGVSSGEARLPGYKAEVERATELSRRGEYDAASAVLTAAMMDAQRAKEHTWLALILNNLGSSYQDQAKYDEAEDVYLRSIKYWTIVDGPNSVELATPLDNLGSLYFEAGQYARSQRVRLRALEIRTAVFGQDHPMVAIVLNNLAAVYHAERKYTLAERTAQRALEFWTTHQGVNSVQAGFSLTVLGLVCGQTGRLPAAELYLNQALKLWQDLLGPEHVQTGKGWANVGVLLMNQGRLAEAASSFEHALQIFQKAQVPDAIAYVLHRYAQVQRRRGHGAEARELEKQAKQFGSTSAHQAFSRAVLDVTSVLPRSDRK